MKGDRKHKKLKYSTGVEICSEYVLKMFNIITSGEISNTLENSKAGTTAKDGKAVRRGYGI